MITELRVRNLALISAADLELQSGLTVLTGETGAGKTALLSSLKLLIGERGDSGIVGIEAEETRVEALFMHVALEEEFLVAATGEVPEACEAQPELLDKSRRGDLPDLPGLPGLPKAQEQVGRASKIDLPDLFEETEHLVVRRINKDGRSRCYLDDSLVTVGRLSSSVGSSVDLYGQHEHQSLLKPSEQLKILDEYSGKALTTALSAYREKLRRHKDAAQELHRIQELGTSSGAEREQAAFVLREIAKVAPHPGEYELLELGLPRLQNGEQLAQATSMALELMRGSGGALEQLDSAVKSLEPVRGVDALLDDPLSQLSRLLIELEEAAADMSRYTSGLEYDAETLQVALDRLGELDGLSRRFGPGMDAVFALIERSEELLQSTEDIDEQMDTAKAMLSEATDALEHAAQTLALLRASKSVSFLKELNSSIADLALAGASLEFLVLDLPLAKWNNNGSQSFELLYSPAPGSPARPLAKIASGGELSRVMLAAKSLLQSGGHSMTLVFDEIDAGIGGKTATAVAERLAQLAQHHQVIVITHLAQIAARADHHFLVSKTSEDSSTSSHVQTSITPLGRPQRVREVARMLSGSVNSEALAHAEKLLKEAHQ